MANQPTFRADPNAVPQINGWPGLVSGVQKGYALAQLPEQMKMEKMLKAAQLQKTQAETTGQENINQYYGQQAEAGIANTQATTANTQATTGLTNKQTSWYDRNAQSGLDRDTALTAGTRASTGLTQQQIIAARTANAENAAFNAALTGAGSPSPQPSYYQPSDANAQPQTAPAPGGQPQYQPGQGGAPMMAPSQSAPQQQPPSAQGGYYGGQPQQAAPQQGPSAAPQERVLRPGNPALSKYDELASNPAYAAQASKRNIGIKTENKYDKDGNLNVITTYPSGKVTVTEAPLQDPAVQAQKAQTAELNKKIADQAAISYGDYTKNLNSSVKIQGDINSLAQAINVPAFDNAVGPVNNFFHGSLGLGDKETNELFGNINSTTGLIQGEMANSISGNAAKAKLYFAQMIKPSSKDTAPVFRGKMEAINKANQWSIDYNSYVAKEIRSGTPVDEAILGADKAVPWDRYQGQMSSFLKNGELASKYHDQGLSVSYQDSGQGDHHPYVDVAAPDGGTLSIPVEKYQGYLDRMKRSKNG